MVSMMMGKRLQQYGHILCRSRYKEIQENSVKGKRMRGRPKHRWMDMIRSDMKMKMIE